MTKKRLKNLNLLQEFLRLIARFQIKHPFITVGIMISITIALIGGISQIQTVSSLEKMMPSNMPQIKSFNTLRDNVLGQDTIAVSININENSSLPINYDITNYTYYEYVYNLENAFKSEDLVYHTYSFADVISSFAKNYSGGLVSKEEYYSILQNPNITSQLNNFVNPYKTGTIILITTDVSANDLQMNQLSNSIKNDITYVGRPINSVIAITGTPIIQQKLGEVIQHDRHITEIASAILVFIFVAIIFGSITAAIVPMIIIILTIIWLYGVMGYVGLPISTLAGSVAAMVIGIGVDYSIHLRNKFEYERKKAGETLQYAIEETMAHTGFVLTIVTIVTSLAFLSFLSGSMPEMGRFGLLMTIGVGIAFILSIIALPALFIIEEKIIYYVKNHLRFGLEKELVLKRVDEKEESRIIDKNYEEKHIAEMILNEKKEKKGGKK